MVGVVADSETGGAYGDSVLADLVGQLALGLTRIPMARQIGWKDIKATIAVGQCIKAVDADVVHGHGAKGAAYARLAAPSHRAIRVYTPHGGSLHYKPGTPAGLVYLTLEKLLNSRTDLFLFESEYAQALFRKNVGQPHGLVRISRNGMSESDFIEATPAADATDLLFIGELRDLKGIDVLLEALSDLRRAGHALSATIVGSGPDREKFEAQAERLGLAQAVRFTGPMPARYAFSLGRIAVVPSRAESLPYIVLEYAAAAIPVIATDVGGIPEIFGDQAARLIPPQDKRALADAIVTAVKNPETIRTQTTALRARISAEFSVEKMIGDGLAAYADTIALRRAS